MPEINLDKAIDVFKRNQYKVTTPMDGYFLVIGSGYYDVRFHETEKLDGVYARGLTAIPKPRRNKRKYLQDVYVDTLAEALGFLMGDHDPVKSILRLGGKKTYEIVTSL
ncbi:MAG: hypothetical protein HQK58_14170 [Deltaproteobacteria bacterium]|nr:hypothetical protein [Deltaproteobacteria bacterium]